MTEAELKERAFAILRTRIRPKVNPDLVAERLGNVQEAVNITSVHIAILATNRSIEVAFEHILAMEQKILKNITKKDVRAQVFLCLSHFEPEIRTFREMHKMLDAGLDCADIWRRVEHLFETNAEELYVIDDGDPNSPSLFELLFGHKPDDDCRSDTAR